MLEHFDIAFVKLALHFCRDFLLHTLYELLSSEHNQIASTVLIFGRKYGVLSGAC